MAARHPLHSICPYFAMFPEGFAERHLLAHSDVGELVYDPFSGRGTTVFQALLLDRRAAGTDINPVAACISGAKADAPSLIETLDRLDELEKCPPEAVEGLGPFFSVCFHQNTLGQILLLRNSLSWRDNRVDRFIAAMALGALHGESHRTRLCFSNRMPRTISTKPEYSVRWWAKHGLEAPDRDVFAILRELAKFRLGAGRPDRQGNVILADARCGAAVHADLAGQVKLIITSPPYIDVTDYAEDQWLRLWFLGGESAPQARLYADDRHTNSTAYWTFLRDVWAGIAALLSDDATIVVRIGGALAKDVIAEELGSSLSSALQGQLVTQIGDGQTSALQKRQTNAFRPGTKAGVEHDFTYAVTRRQTVAMHIETAAASIVAEPAE
ncbi:MAG: DNA methyltransferase [Beijerinckiaceae bacterium]|jgi:hypothetical protein|nr:DNA methyltransferase [Beijerinckiaceae bacterium]